MKAQPERKWSYVKAGILAGFGLALAGLAIALPQSTPPSDSVAGGPADPHGMIGMIRAEDEAPFEDPRSAAAAPTGSRDPSLAGLRVSRDAPDLTPIETF